MTLERLVDDERSTEVDAETNLFRAIYPQLRRLAAAIGPEEVEPDDLVQEAVERAIRRQPLTDLVNPAAYLSRTIVNLAANQRRSFARARRANAQLHESVTQPAYPSDLNDLMRLPAKQRAMLYLRDVEGCSYSEIAERLGMQERAVARATQRARHQLGKELREEMT